MNQIKKIIVCFVLLFAPLLLSNLCYAMPDLYAFNNYFQGQSPYYFTGGEDGVFYYPNFFGKANSYEGVVTSFSDQHMNGATPPSAVPYIDLDYTVGKVFSLEPGQCFVVSSTSGDIEYLYHYGDIHMTSLGYTKPSINGQASSTSYSNKLSDSNGVINLSSLTTFTYDAAYIGYAHKSGSSNTYLTPYVSGSYTNYSQIYFIMNFSENTAFFTVSSEFTLSSSSVVTYEAESISMDKVSFILTNFGDNAKSSYLFAIPHIKGKLDVNSFVISQTTPYSKYRLSTRFNVNTSISLDSSNKVVLGFDSQGLYMQVTGSSDFVNVDNYKPFFLNIYDGVVGLYPSAIYIKDGYVNIQNYNELINLLKEQGIGQSDLTRVTELLTELNTGGVSGEEAKELIGILESYHDQIINQSNFSGATDVFDTYKNILDFTQDMHWLVTANNALFEYFAGFIMLCCMFFFLSRVMR